MTLTVTWVRTDDGWRAVCDTHPGWKFVRTSPDKAAAEKSLKSYHSRRLQFSWWTPAEALLEGLL